MKKYELTQDYCNPANLGNYSEGYQFYGKEDKFGKIIRIVQTKRYSCDNETMQNYIEYFDPNVLKEVG